MGRAGDRGGGRAGGRSYREIGTARRAEPGASALWQGSYRRYSFADTSPISLGALGQIVQTDQDLVGLDALGAAGPGAACFSSDAKCGLRVSSGSRRRSPPSSSISSAACHLSSALTFLTSVGRTADSRTCSYLQAASASGPSIQSSEVSYVYLERVAAAAPATALARSSCPLGA